MNMTRDTWEDVLVELGSELNSPPIMRRAFGSVCPEFPSPLKDIYSKCEGGDLLVGHVYRQSDVTEYSKLPPFTPDWLCFGDNRYGTYWLCSRASRDGLWFTSWDHDSGTEIDGAIYKSFGELLRDAYESMLDGKESPDNFLVITAIPERSKIQAISAFKILTGAGSTEANRNLSLLPVNIPLSSVKSGHSALKELRANGVACHLKLAAF
jgi:hypothetical protein